MPVEKTTIQDPTHLASPETDRVRPTGNRRKLKQILHVAYVCESGHSPDLGPRSTDVSRGNHRRSTTSQNLKSRRYRGSNPGHIAYADAQKKKNLDHPGNFCTNEFRRDKADQRAETIRQSFNCREKIEKSADFFVPLHVVFVRH